MNIKREIVTSVMIDDEKELEVGDYARFIANDLCLCGAFVGITKRGCLTFRNRICDKDITFNVMPYSIKEIEVIEHEVK